MAVGESAQRRDEVRALSSLALAELGIAAGGIGKVHRAVSDRIFWAVGRGVGPFAQPVKRVHDVITDGVYRAVSGSATAGSVAAEKVADWPFSKAGYGKAKPPSRTVGGSILIGAVLGLRGDVMATQASALAAPMSIRIAGQPVGLDPDSLRAAFPDATGKVVVFLHGLTETEDAWRLGGRPAYSQRLGEDGWTGVQVRYNSGLHISENGELLDGLLHELVANWPVQVDSVALVGHSMGGLVIRSAMYQGQHRNADWVFAVTKVVCLGTPHLGAPLELIAHYASAALVKLPETRPFGQLLRRRSAGIRDLRQGSLVADDWRDEDPELLRARVVQEIPLAEQVDYYFVSACITRNARNPLGRIIGDGLVLPASASGNSKARRLGFDMANGMHIGRAHHFTLLNNEALYAQLRKWLSS